MIKDSVDVRFESFFAPQFKESLSLQFVQTSEDGFTIHPKVLRHMRCGSMKDPGFAGHLTGPAVNRRREPRFHMREVPLGAASEFAIGNGGLAFGVVSH